MQFQVLLFIAALVVTQPNDSVVHKVYHPGEAGAVHFVWTPACTKKPVFNHFVNAPMLLLRTHYTPGYQSILQLSVGQVHHLRSNVIQIAPGEHYRIIAFWRHVGTMFEAAVYVNGRLVGHLFEPARTYKSWSGFAWIGARNLIPVSDPTFPGCQHADGKMGDFLLLKW